MTSRGFYVLCIALLFLVMGLATGGSVMFLPAVCLGFILAFSLLTAYLAAVFISCTGDLSQLNVSRGETVNYTVTIHGLVLFPVTGDLSIAPPGAGREKRKLQNNCAFFLSFGMQQKSFSFPLECRHRGVFKVGLEKLRIHDVFGFFSFPVFQKNVRAVAPYSLSVHPVVCPIEGEIIPRPTESGLSADQLQDAASGDALTTSREYRYGDPFKRINWKQTARARRIYIRRYEPEENSKALILLDTLSFGDAVDYADLASDIAASLTKFYLNRACSVGVMLVRIRHRDHQEEYNRYLTSDGDFSYFNNLLISIPFSASDEPLDIILSDYLAGSHANVMHIITNQPSAGMIDQLKVLQGQGFSATCIVPKTDSSRQENEATLFYIDDVQKLSEVLGGHL